MDHTPQAKPSAAFDSFLSLVDISDHQSTSISIPKCLSNISDNDPYWSTSEVLQTDHSICEYSDECSRSFTVRQRVSSVRGLLRAAAAFFQKYNVTYTVYGGSGIGAWRCGDVLPWDDDADVLVQDADMPKLFGLLSETPQRFESRRRGGPNEKKLKIRSLDMADVGFEGFLLAQKNGIPIGKDQFDTANIVEPLAIVDRSTGFFLDIFPAKAMPDGGVYSPWGCGLAGQQPCVACKSSDIFYGLGMDSGTCYNFTQAYLWPPKPCKIDNFMVMCPNDNFKHLLEIFPDVETPDQGGGLSEEFLLKFTLVILCIPLVMWILRCNLVLVVFTFYVGLYIAWGLVTYATGGVVKSATTLVLNSLLIKFGVSLVLWRAWEGESFLQLPSQILKERRTLAMYIVPASLYAVGDVLSVEALTSTDLSTFAILRNSRILFLIFVWQYFLNRKLEAIHWLSLLAILCGCVAKELPHSGLGIDASRSWAYITILMLGVTFSIAAVLNEKLLQGQPSAGVSLQNLAMYGWGTVSLLLVSVVREGGLSFADWNPSSMREPLVLLASVVMAFHGITAGYFLKHLSSIAREVALGVYTVASIVMDVCLMGRHLGAMEYVGISLVMSGVLLFASRPVIAKPVDKSTGFAPEAHSEEPINEGSLPSREA